MNNPSRWSRSCDACWFGCVHVSVQRARQNGPLLHAGRSFKGQTSRPVLCCPPSSSSPHSCLRARDKPTHTSPPHWTNSLDLSEAVWYLNAYEIVMNLITLFNEVWEVPQKWLQPCFSSQLGAAVATGGGRTTEWRTVTNTEGFVGYCRASRRVDRSATLLWNRLQGRFTVCARWLDPTNPIWIPLREGIFPQSCMLTRYIRYKTLQPHRSYFAYILDRWGWF